MAFFEFPHSRTYDSDLGWLIKKMGELIQEYGSIDAWKATHEKEYRELARKVDGLIGSLVDVIVPWDSSKAYRVFTIVEYQGTNYIALKDVPIGVMITNTEYWQPANTVTEQINAIAVIVESLQTQLLEQASFNFGVQRPAMKCNLALRGKIKELVGETNYTAGFTSMQSCCITPDGRLIIGIINGSAGTAVLVKTDLAYNYITRSGVLPIGHVNDMTYNPNTGTIFLTTGYDGTYPQSIVEINEFLQIVNSYDIDITNWCISYDADHDRYFVVADEGLYIFNSDFSEREQLPYDLGYAGEGTIHIQSSEYVNSIFWVMTFTEDNGAAGYTGAQLIGFNENGDRVAVMHYPLADPSDEPESIFKIGSSFKILSGQSWFREYELVDRNHVLENYIDAQQNSKTLVNGTDLNAVTVQGLYRTVNAAGTYSLVNEPTGGYSSISLIVESIQWYAIKQTVTAVNGNSWTRSYDTPNDTWTDWEKVATRSNLVTQSETATIANNTSTLVFTIPLPPKKSVLIDATASFATNSNGRRMLSIDGEWKVSTNAVADDQTRISAVTLCENRSNASRNIGVRVFQSSGNDLSVENSVRYYYI